jgi:hypothetical protein
MSRKRKFRPGDAIKDLHELVARCQRGEWIYWYQRPKHPSLLLHQQITTAIGLIRRGVLRVAIKNEEDES